MIINMFGYYICWFLFTIWLDFGGEVVYNPPHNFITMLSLVISIVSIFLAMAAMVNLDRLGYPLGLSIVGVCTLLYFFCLMSSIDDED